MKVRVRAAGESGWRWAREGGPLKAGGQQGSRQVGLSQNLVKAMSCNQEEDGSEKGQSPQGQGEEPVETAGSQMGLADLEGRAEPDRSPLGR